jgi:hypothetical protein
MFFVSRLVVSSDLKKQYHIEHGSSVVAPLSLLVGYSNDIPPPKEIYHTWRLHVYIVIGGFITVQFGRIPPMALLTHPLFSLLPIVGSNTKVPIELCKDACGSGL